MSALAVNTVRTRQQQAFARVPQQQRVSLPPTNRRLSTRCALVAGPQRKTLMVNILKTVSTGAAVAATSTLLGSGLYYQHTTVDYEHLATFHSSEYAKKLNQASRVQSLGGSIEYAPSVMAG